MVLYMNMKQLGKRRNTVDQVPFSYAAAPGSLRELIAETVKLCVSRYIEAMNRSAYQCADRRYGADWAHTSQKVHNKISTRLLTVLTTGCIV
ncbi:hypothetical protein [Eubacterium sp. MSJ-33]|uniref:hypothetical protein n=1 Tax=Eubacterium sp. MSJ-33 TaxID=2841528 RepID=UPI001C7638F7|nr:hypothetical protein [Eubacterium sp. MSJ-33]QWT53707.1 hypothetical protein KP625_03545 [Eubacterium sp. MSJ-33]